MNREHIARRVDLIGPSTGAIVSVATWCALHGADADAIMAYIVEKMKHRDSTDAQRASLIFLLHELLLTCATRGVSDSAKRSILIAVSRTLPRAVQDTLRQRSGEHTAFLLALQKATEWWGMLNLFPAAWLAQLQRTTQQAQEEAGQNTAVPSTLLQVATLMQRYQHAKEQWLQNKKIKEEESVAGSSSVTGSPEAVAAAAAGTGGGASANSAMVDDAAHRCLIALRKAVEARFERNTALLAWCEAERAELEGRAALPTLLTQQNGSGGLVKTELGASAVHSPSSHGAGGAPYTVKEEGGQAVAGGGSGSPVGGANDDDDVLGSFFS